MITEPSIAAEFPAPGSAVSKALSKVIGRRYGESGAARYGISSEQFVELVAAVVARYAAAAPESDQLELIAQLKVEDMVLARACSAGNDAAWETFLLRFRSSLYDSAYRMAKNEATGREIADDLYAELYGLPNRDGSRVSKLDYYMGRGSLEGWLRTVLSQHFIDRCRSYSKNISLEEQLEAGVSFPAPIVAADPQPDPRLAAALEQSLDELSSEDRFLLASYYLDRCTLAQLARQLHVHESTMSRRLDRITAHLRKCILKRLRATGLSTRQCDELMQDLDVRDLDVDVAAKLRQENPPAAFYKKGGSAT